MLTRFRPQYLNPSHRSTHSPGRYIASIYGSKSPQASSLHRCLQQKSPNSRLSSASYYTARAVDPSLLPIALHPNKPTYDQSDARRKSSPRNPNMFIMYYACDMALIVFVDISYL
jgi:hypothetical protein